MTLEHSSTPLQALVMDWGGVLTASLDGAMTTWAQDEGVDFGHYRDVVLSWVGQRTAPGEGEPPIEAQEHAHGRLADTSPIHRFERGELSESEFEHLLADELARRGSVVQADGLVSRMIGRLGGLEPRMIDVVRRARDAGLRTALLSNSWGLGNYPDALWDNLFEVVVLSGEVGLRKPEPAIFGLTSQRLGLPPQACVMVDDLAHNVRASVAAGMVGVHHRTYDETVGELEALFPGVAFR